MDERSINRPDSRGLFKVAALSRKLENDPNFLDEGGFVEKQITKKKFLSLGNLLEGLLKSRRDCPEGRLSLLQEAIRRTMAGLLDILKESQLTFAPVGPDAEELRKIVVSILSDDRDKNLSVVQLGDEERVILEECLEITMMLSDQTDRIKKDT